MTASQERLPAEPTDALINAASMVHGASLQVASLADQEGGFTAEDETRVRALLASRIAELRRLCAVTAGQGASVDAPRPVVSVMADGLIVVHDDATEEETDRAFMRLWQLITGDVDGLRATSRRRVDNHLNKD